MKLAINYRGRKYYWSIKKFVLNTFVIFFFTAILIFIAQSVKAGSDQSFKSIVVRRGDSLWSIAQQISPNKDPRVTIQKIKFHNNLNNVDLVIGQRLRLFVEN